MSYNGSVDIGMMGDYDVIPDLERFGRDIEDSVSELLEAARTPGKARRTAPAKVGTPGS